MQWKGKGIVIMYHSSCFSQCQIGQCFMFALRVEVLAIEIVQSTFQFYIFPLKVEKLAIEILQSTFQLILYVTETNINHVSKKVKFSL